MRTEIYSSLIIPQLISISKFNTRMMVTFLYTLCTAQKYDKREKAILSSLHPDTSLHCLTNVLDVQLKTVATDGHQSPRSAVITLRTCCLLVHCTFTQGVSKYIYVERGEGREHNVFGGGRGGISHFSETLATTSQPVCCKYQATYAVYRPTIQCEEF